MEFKFEKLIIWQKAMEFGEIINKLPFSFPKEKIYNLSSQIRSAVDSIAWNISEEEFAKHYKFAFNLMNMMVAFKKGIR